VAAYRILYDRQFDLQSPGVFQFEQFRYEGLSPIVSHEPLSRTIKKFLFLSYVAGTITTVTSHKSPTRLEEKFRRSYTFTDARSNVNPWKIESDLRVYKSAFEGFLDERSSETGRTAVA